MPRKPIIRCPVERYARGVVDGQIVAGKLVRLACERHLRDLADGPARGLKWDRAARDRIFQFVGHLRLPEKDGGGNAPFTLQPFQHFILGSLFGWKNADGSRRYRTAYIEQGKGSGKTPLLAAIGLYGLIADGESAAEIYAAATSMKQANILFRDAKMMAEASPALASRLDIGLYNMAHLRSNSFFRAVSSEHRGLDGPRPHMGLIDELHEHPSSLVVDKIRRGIKRRTNPLVCEITNSGHDRTTICWQHHDYSAQVLRRLIENDSWFAYVCQLDPCAKCEAEGQTQPTDGCPDCDDWKDERSWLKANPGMGTILPVKYLREQVAEASGMPATEGIVRRLNFCCWTAGCTKAIPMDAWDACGRELELAKLDDTECYLGVDIGATSDFTAGVLLFPHDDEEEIASAECPAPAAAGGEGSAGALEPPPSLYRRSYTLLPYFWLPEHPVRRSEQQQQVIDGWRRQGLVKITGGDSVDYDEVIRDVRALSEKYVILEVGFDRGFQGNQFGTDLQGIFGDNVISVPQGILTLNSPFREFLEMLKTRRIHHGGHPVMRWMCANTVAETRGGLVKPSKDKSPEKIDGVTAAVMALARAMLRPRGVTALMGTW